MVHLDFVALALPIQAHAEVHQFGVHPDDKVLLFLFYMDVEEREAMVTAVFGGETGAGVDLEAVSEVVLYPPQWPKRCQCITIGSFVRRVS